MILNVPYLLRLLFILLVFPSPVSILSCLRCYTVSFSTCLFFYCSSFHVYLSFSVIHHLISYLSFYFFVSLTIAVLFLYSSVSIVTKRTRKFTKCRGSYLELMLRTVFLFSEISVWDLWEFLINPFTIINIILIINFRNILTKKNRILYNTQNVNLKWLVNH